MQRILFHFEKGDPVRFLSHLDLMRTFERALRRAEIPIALSEGFNPRPKLVFASALALGATSDAEVATIELSEFQDISKFMNSLNSQLPNGLKVFQAQEIPAQGRSPLGNLKIAEYRLECEWDSSTYQFDDLKSAIQKFMALDDYEMIRKSPKGVRKINIRTKILDIEPVSAEDNRVIFLLHVGIGGSGSVKPAELVTALSTQLHGMRLIHMHRTQLLPAEPAVGQEN